MNMVVSLPLSSIARESWDAIQAQPRTPMRQYDWARSYQESLARGEVRAVVVGPASAPVALAPFAVPLSGPRRPVLLGAEDLWESIEVAAGDEAALKVLAEHIAKSKVALRFGHHPTDTRFLEFLRSACRGRALVVARMQASKAMPRIALDETWIEPESHFSSRRRSDFRRMGRKARELGKVEFEIRIPREAELEALLDEAFAIEARGWKGRSGTAIEQDAKTESFYRRYARRAARQGILRLCFLRIDGVAAAMQFAVECEESFWLLKVGYDEAFKHVSPGNLLMRETIGHAAREGLRTYEFLGKEAEWTKLWASNGRPIATLRTYPFNLAGAYALLTDGLNLLRKRMIERIGALRAGGVRGDA